VPCCGWQSQGIRRELLGLATAPWEPLTLGYTRLLVLTASARANKPANTSRHRSGAMG
jgi:hypothetical protein